MKRLEKREKEGDIKDNEWGKKNLMVAFVVSEANATQASEGQKKN